MTLFYIPFTSPSSLLGGGAVNADPAQRPTVVADGTRHRHSLADD